MQQLFKYFFIIIYIYSIVYKKTHLAKGFSQVYLNIYCMLFTVCYLLMRSSIASTSFARYSGSLSPNFA